MDLGFGIEVREKDKTRKKIMDAEMMADLEDGKRGKTKIGGF
jgi:hypothetical protein